METIEKNKNFDYETDAFYKNDNRNEAEIEVYQINEEKKEVDLNNFQNEENRNDNEINNYNISINKNEMNLNGFHSNEIKTHLETEKEEKKNFLNENKSNYETEEENLNDDANLTDEGEEVEEENIVEKDLILQRYKHGINIHINYDDIKKSKVIDFYSECLNKYKNESSFIYYQNYNSNNKVKADDNIDLDPINNVNLINENTENLNNLSNSNDKCLIMKSKNVPKNANVTTINEEFKNFNLQKKKQESLDPLLKCINSLSDRINLQHLVGDPTTYFKIGGGDMFYDINDPFLDDEEMYKELNKTKNEIILTRQIEDEYSIWSADISDDYMEINPDFFFSFYNSRCKYNFSSDEENEKKKNFKNNNKNIEEHEKEKYKKDLKKKEKKNENESINIIENIHINDKNSVTSLLSLSISSNESIIELNQLNVDFNYEQNSNGIIIYSSDGDIDLSSDDNENKSKTEESETSEEDIIFNPFAWKKFQKHIPPEFIGSFEKLEKELDALPLEVNTSDIQNIIKRSVCSIFSQVVEKYTNTLNHFDKELNDLIEIDVKLLRWLTTIMTKMSNSLNDIDIYRIWFENIFFYNTKVFITYEKEFIKKLKNSQIFEKNNVAHLNNILKDILLWKCYQENKEKISKENVDSNCHENNSNNINNNNNNSSSNYNDNRNDSNNNNDNNNECNNNSENSSLEQNRSNNENSNINKSTLIIENFNKNSDNNDNGNNMSIKNNCNLSTQINDNCSNELNKKDKKEDNYFNIKKTVTCNNGNVDVYINKNNKDNFNEIDLKNTCNNNFIDNNLKKESLDENEKNKLLNVKSESDNNDSNSLHFSNRSTIAQIYEDKVNSENYMFLNNNFLKTQYNKKNVEEDAYFDLNNKKNRNIVDHNLNEEKLKCIDKCIKENKINDIDKSKYTNKNNENKEYDEESNIVYKMNMDNHIIEDNKSLEKYFKSFSDISYDMLNYVKIFIKQKCLLKDMISAGFEALVDRQNKHFMKTPYMTLSEILTNLFNFRYKTNITINADYIEGLLNFYQDKYKIDVSYDKGKNKKVFLFDTNEMNKVNNVYYKNINKKLFKEKSLSNDNNNCREENKIKGSRNEEEKNSIKKKNNNSINNNNDVQLKKDNSATNKKHTLIKNESKSLNKKKLTESIKNCNIKEINSSSIKKKNNKSLSNEVTKRNSDKKKNNKTEKKLTDHIVICLENEDKINSPDKIKQNKNNKKNKIESNNVKTDTENIKKKKSNNNINNSTYNQKNKKNENNILIIMDEHKNLNSNNILNEKMNIYKKRKLKNDFQMSKKNTSTSLLKNNKLNEKIKGKTTDSNEKQGMNNYINIETSDDNNH
ncbi:conserved Plasmodium protein, unknown function [Plasmodium relictum]|uniref:Hpc2-related domain-containing protein n=1 Tax=Plasmodium relictum TaxID=85471 RepID=A0A1J1H954_PLARL|nr:conserved Plasmodium protein, unknown function [Plasmodium relictum]CRH01443.1 conserved Plasmodium protein, unknown function [Plasmodium relictum]